MCDECDPGYYEPCRGLFTMDPRVRQNMTVFGNWDGMCSNCGQPIQDGDQHHYRESTITCLPCFEGRGA